MAQYQFYVKTKGGESKKGTLEAANQQAAISTLQEKGLVVISVQEAKEESIISKGLNIFQGVSSKELAIFSRMLALLFEVSVPLTQALTILKNQTKNTYFKEVLEKIVADIQDGAHFSEALGKYEHIFGRLYVAMAKSGEATGDLTGSLTFMADYLEANEEMKGKVTSAMLYPIVIIIIFIGVAGGVVYFILPDLLDQLAELGGDQELPLTTQIVMSISDFLQAYILFVLGGIIAIIGGLFSFFKTETGKQFWNKYQLKLPVFGDLFTKMYVARFALNLRTLMSGSIPLVEALEINAEVVGNRVYAATIRKAAQEVKKGNKMSDTFLASEYFPDLSAQIIQIGEQSGRTQDVLKTLSDFYEREVNAVVENLSTLIEPFVIVFIGVGVGAFVLSILMPLYESISSAL